jgi:hypothetical protein
MTKSASSSKPPQLPPPKVEHVYVERGAGGSKVEKNS